MRNTCCSVNGLGLFFWNFSVCIEWDLAYLYFHMNILYWEIRRRHLRHVLFHTVSFSIFYWTVFSPLMLRGQEMWLCTSTSSTIFSHPVSQTVTQLAVGEATQLHLLSTCGDCPRETEQANELGGSRRKCLSHLCCDFYVCSTADSNALKISCEGICLIVHLLLVFIINSEHVTLLYN